MNSGVLHKVNPSSPQAPGSKYANLPVEIRISSPGNLIKSTNMFDKSNE